MSAKENKSRLDLKELNNSVFEEAEHYRNLQIFGCEIICPYYINRPVGYLIDLMRNVGIDDAKITEFYSKFKENSAPYGWYQGKGTAPQIEDTIKHFLPYAGFGRPKITPEGLRDLMRLRGVGVDCSGFVFNILSDGFKKVGLEKEFRDSISWRDSNKQNVFQANVKTFYNSSFSVTPPNLRPLDIAIMENQGHIAIVLNDTDGYLKVYQSTPWCSPSGVNVSNLLISGENLEFSFIPSMGDNWNEMYKRGKIEFRRLNIFKV